MAQNPTETLPAIPRTAAPLPSGAAMPLVGFGTWQLSGAEATTATATALALGYRHLDTATIYRNEREVGAGLLASGLPREKVFVTTKLPPDHDAPPRATLEQSLQKLGTDVVDLWLIHWPGQADLELWREFVRAQQDGLVRDIGVSNFTLAQIDELADATGVQPAVNQIKWSPYLYDAALLDGHRERGIVVEGYSGLKGGTLQEPVVAQIAERHGATPAQVLVSWQVQHGVVAIPKSTREQRIRENADVDGLVLTEAEMAALDGLARRA